MLANRDRSISQPMPDHPKPSPEKSAYRHVGIANLSATDTPVSQAVASLPRIGTKSTVNYLGPHGDEYP